MVFEIFVIYLLFILFYLILEKPPEMKIIEMSQIIWNSLEIRWRLIKVVVEISQNWHKHFTFSLLLQKLCGYVISICVYKYITDTM